MAQSMSARYTVENDADPTMMELLRCYGYTLKLPGGWRMLAGFLNRDQLDYARQVIEARYGTTTPPVVDDDRAALRLTVGKSKQARAKQHPRAA